MSSPSEAASGKGGTGNALAGTASFLFRTMTLALLKYLQSCSEMSVHIGSASLRYPLRIYSGCLDSAGLPRANTNVVTMMLGERIADRIRQGRRYPLGTI
jgi:hypothetical protein